MNKIKGIAWTNSWLQKLDRDSRKHKNCIRFGIGETNEHIIGKVNVIHDIVKLYPTTEFRTECYSRDKKFRADVVVLNPDMGTPLIIEIVNSEAEESIEEKKKYWTSQGFEFDSVKV